MDRARFAERLAALVNFLRRRRFDIRHRLLFGLGAFPQSDASFDEPALLRRPELLNQRVDARLALIAVVAIDSHIISSRTEFALVGCARLVLGCRLEQGGPEDGIGADCATKRILVTMWGGYPDGPLPGCAERNTGLVTLLSRRCGLIASANLRFSTPTVQK